MKKYYLRTKKYLIKVWPYLTIVAFVSLFFWKFIIKGLIPIPADITVGMYFPWLDYKWGFEVGVPVKNSLLSDVVSQIYPLRVYTMELIKTGIFPGWNPLMFGGYPLLGNIQLGILNPTNLLYFFFPNYLAWGWQILSQPLAAAIFTYLFLRSLKLSKLSSVFGALAYSFTGFNLIWMEWGVHGFATAFLPFMLFCSVKYFDQNKLFFGPLISIVICLQIFSGYPQVVLYSLAVLLFFVLFNFNFNLKKLIFFGLWIFLGFGLSAIQLLPTIELFNLSQRKTETLSVGQSYLPWKYLISFFAPDFFGNQTTGNFWGQGDYTNTVGYSGLIVFILAMNSLFICKKDKSVKFFILCFLFSLLFALPITAFLLTKFKMFAGQGAMAATRVLFICNFSLAFLAAFSFDRLWKEPKSNTNLLRTLYLPLIILGGVYLGCFLAIKKFILLSPLATDPFSADILGLWMRNLRVGLRNLILPSLLIFGTAVMFVLAIKIKKIKNFCLFFVCITGVLELFRFGWKFIPFVEPKLIFPSTPVIDFLKKQDGIFRVDGGDAIPMNMLSAYGLESLSAYDPMYPLQTARFLSLADNGQIDNPKSRYGKIDTLNSPLVDLANICYVLSVKRDEQSKPDSKGLIGGQFRLEKFKPVFEDKTVVVLKNNQCFERVWLTRQYGEAESPEAIAGKITDPKTDLKTTIYLEKKLSEKIEKTALEKNEKVDWRLNLPGEKQFDVVVNKPSIIFIADSYYPGWQAIIDNEKAEVYRADFVFQAVVVPGGKHLVKLVYKPESIELGFKISLTFFSLLIFFGVLSLKLPICKNKKI